MTATSLCAAAMVEQSYRYCLSSPDVVAARDRLNAWLDWSGRKAASTIDLARADCRTIKTAIENFLASETYA